MAVNIEFTATAQDGTKATRISPSMPYVAALMVQGEDGHWGAYSWHKSFAAAHKAANGAHPARVYPVREVVPVVPTAIKGKVTEAMFADGWGDIPASAFTELVAAKLAAQAPAAPSAKDGKETPAQARARQRAAKKAREAAAAEAPVAKVTPLAQVRNPFSKDSILAAALDAAKAEVAAEAEAEAPKA